MDHIYSAGRCIFCHHSALDNSIYDETERCEKRTDDRPLAYSTATDSEPVQSHGQPF